MEYAVSDIVKEVKVILDRNQESAAMIPDDSDTLSQGEIIKSKIVDAARIIESNAPSYMVDSLLLTNSGSVNQIGDYYKVTVDLNNYNILRFLSISCPNTHTHATIITEDDARYSMLNCKWRVFGTVEHPVAVVTQNDDYEKCIEVYVVSKVPAFIGIRYVEEPSISDGKINLSQKLKDAILYMDAYLTCISLGDTQTAEGYKSVAYQLANIVEPSQS